MSDFATTAPIEQVRLANRMRFAADLLASLIVKEATGRIDMNDLSQPEPTLTVAEVCALVKLCQRECNLRIDARVAAGE